ncbi:MAG: type II secretion system F family protein [Bacilli bacterium]
MAIFKYRAMDSDGFISNGEFEAIDRADLESYLNGKGLYLLDIKKDQKFNLTLKSQKITMKDIIIFSRQFSIMITAGITVDESIRNISTYTTNKELTTILKSISDDINKGIPVSESMKKHDKAFKYFFVSMMKVGEFSGEMDQVLKNTADFYEKEGKLAAKIKGAMFYPIVLVVATIGIVAYLMVSVVPMFQDLFGQQRLKLPLITQILVNISDFMKAYGIFILLGMAIGLYLLIRYIRTEKGKKRFDAFVLKIPIVKDVVVKVTTARFARSMDILLNSGITIIQSFDIIDSLMSNKSIVERFDICKEGIRLGYSYSSSLNKMEFFPPILINMVAVGEKTGSLSEVFAKTSDFFDQEADQEIDHMITMIEPIMLVVIGSLICLIFLAMMLPMFDLMNNVTATSNV